MARALQRIRGKYVTLVGTLYSLKLNCNDPIPVILSAEVSESDHLTRGLYLGVFNRLTMPANSTQGRVLGT